MNRARLVCATLTAPRIEPPAIDAWDHAPDQGRLVEIPTTV